MTAQPLSEQEIADGEALLRAYDNSQSPRAVSDARSWLWAKSDRLIASARERLTLAAEKAALQDRLAALTVALAAETDARNALRAERDERQFQITKHVNLAEAAIAQRKAAEAERDALVRERGEACADLAAARAEGERLRAMLDVATKRLTAIYMLLAPTDTIVDGKRYRFTPPDPAQYWRGLSDAIREIEEQFRPQPPALAAIASSRKGSEG